MCQDAQRLKKTLDNKWFNKIKFILIGTISTDNFQNSVIVTNTLIVLQNIRIEFKVLGFKTKIITIIKCKTFSYMNILLKSYYRI